MDEYKGIVTIEGNPLTLTGNKVGVGQHAPDFESRRPTKGSTSAGMPVEFYSKNTIVFLVFRGAAYSGISNIY